MMKANKTVLALAVLAMALAGAVAFTASDSADAVDDTKEFGYGLSANGVMKVIYSETTSQQQAGYVLAFSLTKTSQEQITVYIDDVAVTVPQTFKTNMKVGVGGGNLAKGTYTLRISDGGSFSEICELHVGPLSISDTAVSLTVGGNKTISVQLDYGGSSTQTFPADGVAWGIKDQADAVTVNDEGKIVGVKEGTATVTATVTNADNTYSFVGECLATVSGSPGPGPGPGPGPTPTTYTVTFTAGTGGTVLPTQVTVASGSAISVSGNVMTIGTGTAARTITATPAAGYELDAWSKTSGTVTSNMTITVSFKAAVLPITKEVPNGSVTIPASVVKDLDIKDAAKLVLAIDKVTPTLSNIPSDAVCFAITLKYDGKVLTAFSSDIEVLLKYVPPTGADVSKLKVYYISDDGRIVENMNAAYNAVRGGMVFGTKHLSVFVVTQNSIEPVPAVLTSISVKTAPSKVAYTAGDKFDPTGLVLSLKYDDGTSKDLAYKGNESKFSFSPDLKTALKVTDKTVTITYEGKTTTQSITVSESPSGGDDNSMMIIIIVIIVLLLIVAIAFFVMKMRI